MFTIENLLVPFESIDLEAMDSVKLLNRVDTKFIFNASHLDGVLNKMVENYLILEINGVRRSRYETLYFDTPEHFMYLQHHNGKLNRYKVRARKYIESNQSFFEIKFKNNKGRTIKSRVEVDGIEPPLEESAANLLSTVTPFSLDKLVPALTVSYTRMTFVNRDRTERVTIDTDLAYQHEQKGEAFPKLVIAELKQTRSKNSLFQGIMLDQHLSETSISKYCLGVLTLNEHLKHNRFKPKVMLINKINHDLS